MSITRIVQNAYMIETPFAGGGTVFLYLLKGDRVALLDTGMTDSPRDILQPALAEIGLALSDVDLILNTHAHMDHIGGNLAIKGLSGAPIHMHAGDIPLAESVDAQVAASTAPLRALDFPPAAVAEQEEHTRRMAGAPAPVDVVLAEGDLLDLGAGVKLRVIHTPGHTAGCVCFLWESEGLLITGDAVQGQGARIGGYPLYHDAAAYRRSVAALGQLGVRWLCLGHAYGGGSTVNYPTRNQADARGLFKESLRVADALQRAVVEAMRQKPGASKREIALAALADLAYHVPQILARSTGMPQRGGPTLLAHIEAATAGTYPL